MINSLRKWATPLTIGSFIVMAVTGVLMFYHKNTGLNETAHEWGGWVFLFAVLFHVVINFGAFKKHLEKPFKLSIVLLCVVVLGLSFITPPGMNKAGPRVIIGALMEAPVEQLAAISDKTEQEIQQELSRNGIENADLGKSLLNLSKGNRQMSFEILGAILTKD